MTSRIEDTAGQAALVAHERNLWALWSRFGRGEGCVLHEEEDALWFDTPVPILPYNAVLRFVVEKDADRRIDALFAHYSRRKVPFVWLVHPSARPLDLADRLRARGLEEAEVCPGMSMDLRCLPEQEGPPTEVEIREVRDRSEVDEALELVAWRWNVPPDVRPALAGVMRAFDVGVPGGAVRCWIARRTGAPVAKVVLNLADGAAGLYGVATRPEARGLGLARYLTLEALRAARREGYTLGILQSTPMARSLYEKIGFRAVAPFRVFTPPDALHL